MRSPVAMCHVNDTLAIAARRLWNHGCTTLPVVREDGKLVGIIDDRDICMAALTQGRPLDKILVNAAMCSRVISVGPDQEVERAEELMAQHHLWRLPVIDGDEKPLGMISLIDLAIESSRPDAWIRNGLVEVGRVVAAIGRTHHDQAA